MMISQPYGDMISHELHLTGVFKEGEGKRQTHGHEIKTMFKNTSN